MLVVNYPCLLQTAKRKNLMTTEEAEFVRRQKQNKTKGNKQTNKQNQANTLGSQEQQ